MAKIKKKKQQQQQQQQLQCNLVYSIVTFSLTRESLGPGPSDRAV